MDGASPPSAHPPKREVFDVVARTNTDNKGIVRPVREYRQTPYGLYMARTADHPEFDALESWVLPSLGLRVSVFRLGGTLRGGRRLYMDVGRFTGPDAQGRWHAVDWYLDIVDVPGRHLALLDVDDLLDAHRAGLIDRGDAADAVRIATDTLTGVAATAHDTDRWFSEQGCPLQWSDDDPRR